MLKRILSSILVIAMIFTSVPVSSYAETSQVFYGDVNEDGKIDLNDILSLKCYIEGEIPEKFSLVNADVNADGKLDGNDLQMLKKYLAEWDVVLGGKQIAVEFYDGDRLIDTLYASQGAALGATPSAEKTSKADGVFVGWYTDPECTVPFYAETPVMKVTKVYAKYDAVPGIEETLEVTSFAKTDVDADHTLTVKGEGDPEQALTLIAKDGSDIPDLQVSDNGNGTYDITAEGGFREGSSYEMQLGDGFQFIGESGELPETIDTAYFTVEKEIVDDLGLNENIIYIADTDAITYSNVDTDEDGQFNDTAEQLDGKIGISGEGSKASVENADSLGIEAGDVICFYVGTAPLERVYTGEDASAYINEPEIYVKATKVTANEIEFTTLSQEELVGVYDIPDVFPLKGTASDHKISLNALDTQVYAQYGIETPTLDYAKEQVAAGDFVAVYADTPKKEADITFGRITAYDEETSEITFEVCTAEAITDSRNIYVQPSIGGDELVTEEEKQQIEEAMLAQIRESGFAEEAAYTLASLSTKTDGFKNMNNLRSVLLSDDSGNPLTDEEIELLSLGASFELKEGVKLSVEIITEGEELHFKDGVQLAVGIEAEFEVEAEEGKVVIDLCATFIEELEVKPTVDGQLTYKKIIFGLIPVPNGVHVTANVDVKNYTAYDFDVTAYTVGEEEKSVWSKLQEVAENPTKITDILSDSGLIPAKYADQLKTVGDVFQKIEEVEKKISDAETKYNETEEQIEGYQEDLESLWAVVEDMHQKDTEGKLFTKETWAQAAKDLSKTNIAQELLHLTDDGITDGDAGVDNNVTIKSVEELMERYSEMLHKETDWVTLLDQKVTEANGGIKAINFMLKVDFMIRTNMSIALGSTLEFETGKRYTFWFKVGLYKPSGGSSTMDLIDESLAFQFYVMGKLEIKMGAKITLGVNIGCSDVAYVGIYTEVGPYVKLYGFFVYTYERLREANTLVPIEHNRKMGALYLETGVYLIVGVEASAAAGIFEVSYDFLDEEFPIMSAGNENYPYAFSYELQEDERINIIDEDRNSSNGVSMVLPDHLRAVKTMTLTSGIPVDIAYDYQDYYISLSNPNFVLDQETGEIIVNAPDGVRYMDCEMRLTYKYGKMAFSDYDISITLPLYWTNLSTEELSEYYTASVRVGNNEDGYRTVWSKRILKNTGFELPSADEIKSMIGYNDLKYSEGAYAENYQTSEGIIEDKVYDFNLTPVIYDLTVTGIQGAEETQTFHAKYGGKFDFSSLENTGKNDAANGEYTIFRNVTTDATVVVGKDADGNDVAETINLSSPISERMALALQAGVTATAGYVDNSATATFRFEGIAHEDLEQKVRKGNAADIAAIDEIAAENGLAVKGVVPAIGSIFGNTSYTVTIGELTGDRITLSFEENGGSEVEDITKVEGSVIGALPVPEKTGYTFCGWYTDNGNFTKLFNNKVLQKQNTTVYAKWSANEYTVSFHVNGGTSNTPKAAEVTYDGIYGTLPKPKRTGYRFMGWFTAAEGGTQITGESTYTFAGNQTLYAQWTPLIEIPKDLFIFDKPSVNPVYNKDTSIDNRENILIQESYLRGETYSPLEFKFEYMLEDGSGGYVSEPKNAGTYLARVSRPSDGIYSKFEKTYTNVLTIDKAVREVPEKGYQIESVNSSYTYMTVRAVDGTVADLHENAKIIYKSNGKTSETGLFDNLTPSSESTFTVNIVDDPNYHDVTTDVVTYGRDVSGAEVTAFRTKTVPQLGWHHYMETVDLTQDTIVISTPGELAYISNAVNNGNSLEGKNIELANDIDLSGAYWKPIGTGNISDKTITDQAFKGNFDGKGHTISGMVVVGIMGDMAMPVNFSGLFGFISNSEIKNVVIDDSYIYGNGNDGAVVGWAYQNCTITNCTSYAVVDGKELTGGILGGMLTSSQLSNCVNYGKVTGRAGKAGGVAGFLSGTVTVSYCENYGDVVSGGSYAGGIVSRMLGSSKVNNAVNYGSVTCAGTYTGGVVGYNEDHGIIVNCANRGTVKGNSSVGGVIGENNNNNGDAEVYNCYTSGTIEGNGDYVGAVIGRNKSNDGSVHQCYYLFHSCTDGGSFRNGVGTENSDLEDGEKSHKVSTFRVTGTTSPSEYPLDRQCESGAVPNNLITALNHWVDRVNIEDASASHLSWVEGADGYPTLTFPTWLTSSLDIRR